MNTLIGIGCVLLFLLLAEISICVGSQYFKRKPYRVVSNGAGKFLVQCYKCVPPDWLEWIPAAREYKYVTFIECDTLEEASAHYRKYMASYIESQKDKRDNDAAECAAKRKNQLNEHIVKVYKL